MPFRATIKERTLQFLTGNSNDARARNGICLHGPHKLQLIFRHLG